MKRTWLASVFALCLGLVAATTYLLALPTPALAATGTAECGGGVTVSCAAYHCTCTDGLGCVADDGHGNETLTKCPKPDNRPIAE